MSSIKSGFISYTLPYQKDNSATSGALGEESGTLGRKPSNATSGALGEESGTPNRKPSDATSSGLGEESGTPNRKPSNATSGALGEESGTPSQRPVVTGELRKRSPAFIDFVLREIANGEELRRRLPAFQGVTGWEGDVVGKAGTK